jgi:uncharacterized damage-inducible protein DinB
MSLDRLIETWREVRAGLIKEASQVPENQFSYRPAPESRTVAEILQHIVEAQKMIVGETSRPDPNLMRQSFADHIKEYAPEVGAISDKNGLLELLRSSMETSEATLRSSYVDLNYTMRRFDQKEVSKLEFLNSAIAHEMYHRGQLTVYERLLGVEPALTQHFKKLFAKAE